MTFPHMADMKLVDDSMNDMANGMKVVSGYYDRARAMVSMLIRLRYLFSFFLYYRGFGQ